MENSTQRLSSQHELMNEIISKVLKAHEVAYLGITSKELECFEEAIAHTKGLKTLITRLDLAITQNITHFAHNSEEVRLSVAHLKITNEIERIGNAARKFSRDIQKYLQDGFKESKTHYAISELYAATLETVRIAAEACGSAHDTEMLQECLSRAVVEESKTDDLFSMIHKEIIFGQYSDDVYLKLTIELFNAIRRLERAADHAVNIIRLMLYARGEVGVLEV